MGIIVLLILSTFAVSLCASELSKETHADHATLTDALGSILGVAEAVAAVPLYVMAAMPMSALGRIRALSVLSPSRTRTRASWRSAKCRSCRGSRRG